MKNGFKTADLIYIALGAELIAICSWISVPYIVPFTLQTFAVFICLLILGGKRGTISILVYILLGTVGMPVFSGFKGGVGALLGTTGGYILGFVLTGVIFLFMELLFGHKQPFMTVALVLGLIACYAFGTAWFTAVYLKTTGPVGVGTALSWCVLPFIIPDILKLFLAVFISSRIRKLLPVQ